jgi:hypothetical protein
MTVTSSKSAKYGSEQPFHRRKVQNTVQNDRYALKKKCEKVKMEFRTLQLTLRHNLKIFSDDFRLIISLTERRKSSGRIGVMKWLQMEEGNQDNLISKRNTCSQLLRMYWPRLE